MEENLENMNESADRPLECGECKKGIAVRYTEVVAGVITHTIMCAECPQLERRLHGIPLVHAAEKEGLKTGLSCANCGTTMESVRMGNFVGCSDCYVVFEDVIIAELISEGRISKLLANVKKGVPFHIGRSQGETKEINPSLRLLALNEALTETLRREDYEQAAWLRDQIKVLTEKQDGQK